MSEIDLIERLSSAAYRQRPPVVDVSERVAKSIIALAGARRVRSWPVAIAMTVACAATLLMVVMAWSRYSDPMVDLFDSVSVVVR